LGYCRKKLPQKCFPNPLLLFTLLRGQNRCPFLGCISNSNDFYYWTFFRMVLFLETNLHKKLPETAPMNLNRFKILLLIPVAYMLLLFVFMFVMISNPSPYKQPNPEILALIIPLHIFSTFCMFYCLNFKAKALKKVELQRPATFSDFVGEFFLILFFSIGIWTLQPRTNKQFGTSME